MIEAGADLAEDERLAALRALRMLDTGNEERFDRLTRLCAALLDVPISLVTLVDRDRQWHKSRLGFDREEITRDESFCTVAIQQSDPLVVEDATQDPRFVDNPLVTGPDHIRFYAGVPVSDGAGHYLGALCVLDHEPRSLTDDQIQVLRDVASLVEREMLVRHQLDGAADVQRNLLPAALPRRPDLEVAAVLRSTLEVGGDFYDWRTAGDDLAVTLADVMGKGLPAALMAATVRGGMRAAVDGHEPGEVLRAASHALEEDFTRTGTFATAFHARISPAGEVRWADAGHGLAYVVRSDGRVEILASSGPPLGLLGPGEWPTYGTWLQDGEIVVVVSDGVMDRLGGRPGDVPPGVREAWLAADDLADFVTRMSVAGRAADEPDDVTVLAVRRRQEPNRKGTVE